MTRHRPVLLFALIILGAAAIGLAPEPSVTAQSIPKPPGTNYKGPAFTFNKIADGVYHAIGTGSLVVMSNAAIIEGDRDVLVVDSHVIARRRLGAARRAEGDHAEADSLRRQQPLSLRSLARQSDLRAGGRDHRPRVRARADPRRQVAGLAARTSSSSAACPNTIKTLEGAARGRHGRQDEARRSRTSSTFSAIISKAPTR